MKYEKNEPLTHDNVTKPTIAIHENNIEQNFQIEEQVRILN